MDSETRKVRARAEAIQAALDYPQRESDAPVMPDFEVPVALELEGARRAVEVLGEGSNLTPLLDQLEEAGKWRAAVQLLKKAGLDDAAERAKGRFDEEWRTLKQIDPKLFDDDQGKRLEKVNAVVQLLRQVGSQYP